MKSFDDTNEYSLLQAGKRECILEEIVEKEPKNGGSKYLNLKWRIRDDVEQPDAGRVIFESFFKDKETNDYRTSQIGSLLRAQGKKKEEGGTYDFEDYDELMQFVTGMKVELEITLNDPDEYHDETYNQVKYCSYKPTKHAPATLGEPVDSNLNKSPKTGDIEQEDLPF